MANRHFNMNSLTSTTQSKISNEDFDGEAAASTTDFNRRATSTPPGLGREILHQPETPGRVPSRGRGLLFRDTPSPTPGIFDDIDPWERDVTSTNNFHSWGNLASRRETPTHAQLDICERIEREHEVNIRATQFLENGKRRSNTPLNGTSWSWSSWECSTTRKWETFVAGLLTPKHTPI